ncbi:MAG TPA: dynamin family protein [Ignavibacteriales bacterium]|nr:dynamin family protein [Ignavibacteriales bacterium]HOL82143.1 dynamin family protein [Ignavibacteriales bacterium]HOM65787.1 dynamin family protein [Ignavibacteriales bacterium]HOP50821.1 dynamin family protein [Ignavibacteriales bacterium]HPD66930.1 dynamin family protein [Ignavibacteriales bacterium]
MFLKSQQIQKDVIVYNNKLSNIAEYLSKFESSNEIYSKDILKIKENFNKKIDDFFNENRKLKIAVVGSVKAGKSTFLNTLLFEGKEILPKAATPKTANLTIIKYAEKNSLEIEFYTEKEWEYLQKLSLEEPTTDEIKVAKEIVAMAKSNNIEVEKYINQTNYVIPFESYDNLMKQLNDYVGENGKLTALTKSVIIYLNLEELKEIEIVDTPGLNDPVVSRTDKTRQFIEYCDVVFFLSRCSQFLPASDMELLIRQLPQKGVNKIYLIGSQYDSVINDTIFDFEDFYKADNDCKKRLNKRAEDEFSKVIENLTKNNANIEFIKIMENCKKPILVSSMAENMSKKDRAMFNEEEMLIYNGIAEYHHLTSEELKSLGNFGSVRQAFYEVVESKDEVLTNKSKNFIILLIEEVTNKLNELEQTIKHRIEILKEKDLEYLRNYQKSILQKKNVIHDNIEIIFDKLFENLNISEIELLADLRRSIKDYSIVKERTGTETRIGSYEVSASKWWNPFSWGRTRTVYYEYTATYTYLDVADAVENLRNYANESVSNIEEKINFSINVPQLKKEILLSVVNNLDTGDENFDPSYYRSKVTEVLNQFTFPEFKLDRNFIKKLTDNLLNNFSGEIRNSGERSRLTLMLSDSLHSLFEIMEPNVKNSFRIVKDSFKEIRASFIDILLEKFVKEIEIIEQNMQQREKSIKHYEEWIEAVNECKKIIKE